MTYTVIGVYADTLQGGCFHVEANTSPEAVAAVGRRSLKREERCILSEWEEERPDGPSS